MDTLEHEFEFEEMNIPVCGKYASGLMLYGKATLSGDEDGFSVVYVELEGGTRLRRCNAKISGMHKFEDELFARIASVIENPKTVIGKRASSEWADVVGEEYASHGRMLNRADALYDARV